MGAPCSKSAGNAEQPEIRLREKGIFNARKNARGDLIVEIGIQAPDIRDDKTRELLRELAKLDPRDPRAELWPKV